jgi:hypothetical protein
MGEALIQVQELARAAREYCDVIEHLDGGGGDWLHRLSCLMPRIHAAVLTLNNVAAAGFPQAFVPDYDLRFELFSRLRDRLGERDRYRLEFDAAEGGTSMSGSLADDITDIYFELKRGLEMLEHDPQHPTRAASAWRSGFLWHWGQHLVDAERHLYELQVSEQLFPKIGLAH